MSNNPLIAIGLDLGTGGARAVAMELDGPLVAETRSDLPAAATHARGPRVEQDPQAWTTAAQKALRELSTRLPKSCNIIGISVDATSGTFLLTDGHHQPLTPGLMYSDLRAVDEAQEADAALHEELAPFGIRVAPAFALAKLIHLARCEPALFARCRHVVHQTDWVIGWLCGRYDVTDVSTALKTGVDPARLRWPDAMSDRLGIPVDLLPTVVLPGTTVGEITAEAASSTGLPRGTPIVAGCTDGTAGCLASGAKEPGDLNVTLGTTLVFKAISERPLIDSQAAVYNHRHPAGGFLPGAASSTGAEWIGNYLPDADLETLGRQAASRIPTGRIVYPLVKLGERFPFACPAARGFGLEEIADNVQQFAAGMEAVAFIERLGIQRLADLGLVVGSNVYATGGAVASEVWLRIRAAVNRRTYHVPHHPQCAVGAAVLAARPHMAGCREAAEALVRPGRTIAPDLRLADAYELQFQRFAAALQERGYIEAPETI